MDKNAENIENKTFTGAILSTGDYMPMRGLPLEDKVQVNIFTDKLVFSLDETTDGNNKPAASLFYDPETQFYCVEPYKNRVVFLKSGQPLGKDRQYHLHRNTEIYIEDKGQSFKLA